jgi:putative endonuclease
VVTRATVRQVHGGQGEAVAAAHLERLGWRVLGHQLRIGRDEVDLLALDPGPPATLVVVEVRSRSTDRFGPPEASVDRDKILRCYRALAALRRTGTLPDGTPLPRRPWRVDLVAVDLDPTLGPGVGGPRVRHLRSVLPP